MGKHSLQLFILGFLEEIQNASSALLEQIFVSYVRIVHLTSYSSPLCSSTLYLPRGVDMLPRLLPARCSLIRIYRGFPVSPIYVLLQEHFASKANILADLLQRRNVVCWLCSSEEQVFVKLTIPPLLVSSPPSGTPACRTRHGHCSSPSTAPLISP